MFIAYKLGNPVEEGVVQDIIVYLSKKPLDEIPDENYKEYKIVKGIGPIKSNDIN